MTCHLCLKEKPLLKESHILSNFLYKPFRGEDNGMISVDRQKKKSKQVYTGEFERDILCADCDNRIFGDYEGYASQIINAGPTGVPGIKTTIFKDPSGIELYAKIEGLDYKKFRLFLLSLLWRVSISGRPYFDKVKLSADEEERLRKMLYDGDPGEPDDYPCVISVAKNGHFIKKTMASPMKLKDGYEFIIAGVIYYFPTTKPISDTMLRGAIQKDGSLHLFILPDDVVGRLQTKILQSLKITDHIEIGTVDATSSRNHNGGMETPTPKTYISADFVLKVMAENSREAFIGPDGTALYPRFEKVGNDWIIRLPSGKEIKVPQSEITIA